LFEPKRCFKAREIPEDQLGKVLHKEPFKKLSHGVNDRIIRNDKELNNIRDYIRTYLKNRSNVMLNSVQYLFMRQNRDSETSSE
jgi:hypothetical protein